MEEGQLYDEFKLDEPWDSEHNSELIPQMQAAFGMQGVREFKPGYTTILSPRGKDFIIPADADKGTRFSQIKDGASNTIFLVNASDKMQVPASKPEDFIPTEENPIGDLLADERKGFHVSFSDGSVRFLDASIDKKTQWAFFTKSGGEIIEDDF